MSDILKNLNRWSEVWSFLIPLTILFIFRPKGKQIRPLILYICIGFLLTLISTILYIYHKEMPPFLKNNNILYNLNSIARVIFFSWYIFLIRATGNLYLFKILLTLYLIFTVINFIFFENPLFLSDRLHTIESIILIMLCTFFFLRIIQDESDTDWLKHPSFLICAGIGFYEVIALFIFLFFDLLSIKDKQFGEVTMTIRKMSFLVLSLFLGISLILVARENRKLK